MSQYLLSVHHDGVTEMPTDEAVIAQMYADVDRFNEKLRAEGAWVFAGGLYPIESSTTVDATGAEADRHRRPVRRVQGVPRRLLGHRGRRPRRRAHLGQGGFRGLPGQGRGPTVPGRLTAG